MRCGIFVDAGYLFAQGSAAIAGEKCSRTRLRLDKRQVIDALLLIKGRCCANVDLLRIYWYDGAANSGPTSQHLDLAFTDNVKLRLGFVNSHGQQKGVDSLIITDMIELARNRTISDAILLSGDEDLRVGVAIAQTYGVRVHLLGIEPSRGSQSQLLLQESDTTIEWSKTEVAKFLAVTVPEESGAEASKSVSPEIDKIDQEFDLVAGEVVEAVLAAIPHDVLKSMVGPASLPRDVDGKLLAMARDKLGRMLSDNERRSLRTAFKSGVSRT